MNGYTDETFPAWYERLTDLERYDFDTDNAAPYEEPITMTHTYKLANPSVRHLTTLRLILSLLNYEVEELDSDTTLSTNASVEQVDRVCCDMGVLIAHEGQYLGCND